MTRCNHIESLFTEYVSDELTPLERAIVDDHLAACAACRAELALAREVADGLASLPDVACPDRVARDILAAVDAEAAGRLAPGRRGHAAWWRTAGLAGTLAAAVLLAVVLPRRAPAPAPVAHDPRPDTLLTSPAQVAAARQELLWTLAYTAEVIERSEQRSLANMWRQVLSRTPDSHTATIPGGQG
ncbi:MAG: zf-HC2 domain-containing protein [Candidatus Krumholzibacteriia bacterium]